MPSELRRLLGFEDVDIPEKQQQQHQVAATTNASTTTSTTNSDDSLQPSFTSDGRILVIPGARSIPATDDAATVTTRSLPYLAYRSVYDGDTRIYVIIIKTKTGFSFSSL